MYLHVLLKVGADNLKPASNCDVHAEDCVPDVLWFCCNGSLQHISSRFRFCHVTSFHPLYLAPKLLSGWLTEEKLM